MGCKYMGASQYIGAAMVRVIDHRATSRTVTSRYNHVDMSMKASFATSLSLQISIHAQIIVHKKLMESKQAYRGQ
jgi:hypothetical protein